MANRFRGRTRQCTLNLVPPVPPTLNPRKVTRKFALLRWGKRQLLNVPLANTLRMKISLGRHLLPLVYMIRHCAKRLERRKKRSLICTHTTAPRPCTNSRSNTRRNTGINMRSTFMLRPISLKGKWKQRENPSQRWKSIRWTKFRKIRYGELSQLSR